MNGIMAWVKSNWLVLLVLLFQIVQAGSTLSVKVAAQEREIQDLRGEIACVKRDTASKELVDSKFEAVRVELAALRAALEQHSRETEERRVKEGR